MLDITGAKIKEFDYIEAQEDFSGIKKFETFEVVELNAQCFHIEVDPKQFGLEIIVGHNSISRGQICIAKEFSKLFKKQFPMKNKLDLGTLLN